MDLLKMEEKLGPLVQGLFWVIGGGKVGAYSCFS